MIKVTDLTKYYGDVQALKGINFSVKPGEIVGLLGPNGAGKTTSIKILTGYLQADSGSVQVDGLDVLNNREQVQARVGYLPESTPLYGELSVQDYLKMMADLREIAESDRQALLSEAVHATGLAERLTQPIAQLSKGFRQRVGLAQAILHRPRLLVLDEPTVGLDPTQIIEIRNLIKSLAPKTTILFSSHILPEVEAICDRVIIIINGVVKADARLAELAATTDAVLVLQHAVSGVPEALRALQGAVGVTALPNSGHPAFRISGTERADLCPLIFDLARKQNWPLRELRRDVRTLEHVFNELALAA